MDSFKLMVKQTRTKCHNHGKEIGREESRPIGLGEIATEVMAIRIIRIHIYIYVTAINKSY